MSLISQTEVNTQPGTYTYIIPAGISTVEFHLWGAGGATGETGPVRDVQTGTTARTESAGFVRVQTGTQQVQTGTREVVTGSRSVQTGTELVEIGARAVVIGTVQVSPATEVQTGTRQVQTIVQVITGTQQVQIGSRQESYTVQVPAFGVFQQTNAKGQVVQNNGKGGAVQTETRVRTVPIFETRPVIENRTITTDVPTFTTIPPVFRDIIENQSITELRSITIDVPVTETRPVIETQPSFGLQETFRTVQDPVFTATAGGRGGVGANGGYSYRKIQVSQGDAITVHVGSAGVRNVGGQGYVVSNSSGGVDPLVELVMRGENWISTFTSDAGTNEDICIAVIDECSVGQSTITADWNAFRSKWPTRPFYLLQPGGPRDLKIPTAFNSDPNAYGPIQVARDQKGITPTPSDWYTIANANALPTGASIRLAVDRSGSLTFQKTSAVQSSIDLLRTKAKFDKGINYSGGSSGSSTAGGRGGGGGAATVVLLNGVVIAVAAGGGGGGGGGTLGRLGAPGSPAVISGIGSGQLGQGQFSNPGPATGGGGGGGFYSGNAGFSGVTGGAGFGGVSDGSIIESGTKPPIGGSAARNLLGIIGVNAGLATFSGAAVLVLTKSFNVNVKVTDDWKSINRAWVKVNDDWKDILNGWVKISGVWEPLITQRSVEGAEDLTRPAITYTLSANRSNVAEGSAVSFTISTTGLLSGNLVPYTASGIAPADLQVGSLSGNFTVGSSQTITFVPRVNNTTNGPRNLSVVLNGTGVSADCTILDTSLTPVYTLTSNVSVINEGQAVRFTLGKSNEIAGQSINYTITGIAASRITSGSLTGTFVVGSSEQTIIAVAADNNTTGDTVMTMRLVNRPASATVTVRDTSRTPVPVYTVSANVSVIDEGQAVRFTLGKINGVVGQNIGYNITSIASSRISSGSLTGTFVVGSNEQAIIAVRADNTTTGDSLMIIQLDEPYDTEIASVTVRDTSLSPIVPVYVVAANVSVINEGQAVRFALGNVNGVVGQTINYNITGIAASRISSGSLTGTFTVGSNEQAIIAVREDNTTTGDTTMVMRLAGISNTASVTVRDTSLTPPPVGTETFTSSTSWIVPDRVFSINITGSGGGGGGGSGDGGKNNDGPGYGGGGSNMISQTRSVTPGQQLEIQVGAGGLGRLGGGFRGGTSTVIGPGVILFQAVGGAGGSAVSGWGGPGEGGAQNTGGPGANGAGSGGYPNGGLSTNGGANGGRGGNYNQQHGAPGQPGKVIISWG